MELKADSKGGVFHQPFQQRATSATDQREKVLYLVRTKGPLLPVQINKELNTNVLFASAMLSELVDNKQLRLTYLKIGGSPLYYAPGQESKLQQYAKHLPEKELRAYELLQEKKVLRDKDQTPLVRATLREIKDYSVLLEVTSDGRIDLFWKWYLLPSEEAEQLIRLWFEQQTIPAPLPDVPPSYAAPHQQLQEPLHQLQQPPSMAEERRSAEPRIEPQTTIMQPIQPGKDENVKDKEKEREDQRTKTVQEKVNERGESKENNREEQKEKKGLSGLSGSTAEKLDMEGLLFDTSVKDKFLKKIKQFCDKQEIKIVDYKILRKEADIELSILIPSNVGLLHYFCKAKNKQRCNEGDVSTAYITGKARNLPVLFLTSGDITKKAEELARREFKTMTIKKV
ncbi:hypothetical protein HYS47_02520 [Candidatus Woesearchaeota archaeon]|nr:hypothetical protein [Candidatus Woesearchaeota archaeon]